MFGGIVLVLARSVVGASFVDLEGVLLEGGGAGVGSYRTNNAYHFQGGKGFFWLLVEFVWEVGWEVWGMGGGG